MAHTSQFSDDSSDPKNALTSILARVLPHEAGDAALPVSNADRRLVMLAHDVAHALPLIAPDANDRLCEDIDALTQRFSSKLADEKKTRLTQSIVQRFDAHAHDVETTLHEQIACWHETTTTLFYALLRQHRLPADSPTATFLIERIRHLVTARDIQEWKNATDNFFRTHQHHNTGIDFSTKLNATDTSTNNDNPFGLFGGGAAIEYLRTLLSEKKDGFIVLFHLLCLDVIRMRFGQEAVEDCLITVAANFTAGLQNEDAIYHWSDSSLLAIVQDRPSEIILSAELEHIVAQHRENTIKIAGRSIMIRIPITFEIFDLCTLERPEDLIRLVNTTPTAQ